MKKLLLLPFALILASCAPTYPREKVLESVVALCRNEYQIEVQAKMSDTTIGVLVPVQGLFMNLPKVVQEKDLEEIAQTLQFSEYGRKAIENVSLALARVILSTDARLEFYTIIARDLPTGLEFIWSGYVTDQKRVSLDISRGDFLQYRTPTSFQLQSERVAQGVVEDFLRDLAVKPVAYLLRRYVAPTATLDQILPAMLEITAARSRFEPSGSDPWSMNAIQISRDLVLVHLNWKGAQVAYLAAVQMPGRGGVIQSMERLDDPKRLPSAYEFLGPPEQWPNQFYVEPMSLPKFLAEQIARRLRLDLSSLSQNLPPLELNVVGTYQDRSFDFHFRFLKLPIEVKKKAVVQGKEVRKPVQSSEEFALALVKTAAEVLNSYGFKDFETLKVTDLLKGKSWMVSAQDLPLYRRRNPPPLTPLH